jgi:small subunit ribosomal protein S1
MMAEKNSQSTNEGEILYPEIDEGWWSSVLKDEESIGLIIQHIPDHQGEVELNSVTNWDRIINIYQEDEIVMLRVQGHNRGGLLVQGEGIHGFVPVSHLLGAPEKLDDEDKRRKFLSRYLGKSMKLKVIECEPSEDRIVLSERAAMAGEGTRKRLLISIKPEDKVAGSVTNITDFGVFIDLGGIEGLIHVSELSWGRVQHPSDILRVGQKIQALVLSVSEENSRVALSLKRLTQNPWDILAATLKTGDVVSVKISSIMRYGVFVKLDEGVEGLIHISSIRMPVGVRDLKRFLRVGQSIKARVLHIDIERRRLGLALEADE